MGSVLVGTPALVEARGCCSPQSNTADAAVVQHAH